MTRVFSSPFAPIKREVGFFANTSEGLNREQRRAVRREIDKEERQEAKKAKALLAKKGGAA